MIKKGLIATGTLISAFALTLGLVMAQTPTTSPSPTQSPTTYPVPRVSPSPNMPSGSPATGMGIY